MTEKQYERILNGRYEAIKDKHMMKNLEDLESVVEEFNRLSQRIKELENENQRLIKMLDNVANYMQKQYKDMPIDDFVEWWNDIATEGL